MSSQAPSDGEIAVGFNDLSLSAAVVAALNDVGYESPSPIQAQTIPHILNGVDLVGQAQTGTGKTAAFALPILSKIDLALREPQALVLAPTRELAIQVAEAFQRYATHMPGFSVLPIYGGQSYTPQLQSLRRGVHVIVGTPGRVMDHLKRGTLNMKSVRYFVLDEADEMLRMGFITDVEWILQQAPESRQIALFSATMPAEVRRIAQNHLRKPAEVTIRGKTATANNIRQRYWMVSGMHKLDALTRILEAETFDAMIVFARTKQATAELAERLEARGFAVEALNGDIPQPQRERTIARLKSGQIDIVVATDVAARGLDVERISHVVNFDVPYDPESYVHRIGRTGRAGRSGDAILFIAPRERNMLRVIERATRQPITQMQLPTMDDVNEQRVNRFNQRITDTLAAGGAGVFRDLIERYEQEHNVPAVEIAAALASIVQGKTPLLLDTSRGHAPEREERAERTPQRFERKREREPRAAAFPSAHESREHREPRTPAATPHAPPRFEKPEHRAGEERPARREFEPEGGHAPVKRREFETDGEHAPAKHHERIDDSELQTYRVEVGEIHGIKPSNIVGAIANEAGVEGKYIGRVVIREDHSFVDLPGGMPKEIFRALQKVRVGGQQLQISLALKTQTQRLKREFVPANKPLGIKKKFKARK
ncbi:DEAD/DEAH box helicase [Povalibacter sp.]|uniref:DEAD/DEAH box helicase n=1 Tax=Povalibacter sp. TaxID=1962978 RepID=UPI002F3ECDAF